ncbi:MAG: alpha/beta fold hydrolase [Micrococcales bacterium]|nr:alpha/beta fold hydrolase [Micrococcales bacterium]MCL2667869.1 alpha/beta fold hydrolase [Micrococcales bacterium]
MTAVVARDASTVAVTGRTTTPVRMLCFPHTGGRASAYARWARDLGEEVEVHGHDYPGRYRRAGEPMVMDAATLLDDAVRTAYQLADKPLVLFGHSMGGWVAFETALRLESEGLRVAGVIVSAARTPGAPVGRGRPDDEDDEALTRRVRAWGGIEESLLADPSFRAAVFPAIRADLAVASDYQGRRGRVRAPLLALAGRDDLTVPSSEVAGWRDYCEDWRGLHIMPGAHFFTVTAETAVLRLVRNHCRRFAEEFSGRMTNLTKGGPWPALSA